MNDFYVYVIYRLDGRPAYVGKGKGKRWQKHQWKSTNPHLACIYAQCGDLPKQKIAEGLTEQEAFALEVQLIAEIGREVNGGPLVNLTDGGEGVSGHKHSPETCAKLGVLKKGNKNRLGDVFPPEHREKLRQAKLGKKQTAEQVEKRIAPLKGRERSAEVKERIRSTMQGVPHTEERKAALKAAWVRRKQKQMGVLMDCLL